MAITLFLISPWLPAGAGCVTLTIVPSGAITFTGLKEPWFKACFGSRADLSVMNTDAAVTANVEFTGAETCFDTPVKSAVSWSSFIVSFSGSRRGSRPSDPKVSK